MAFRAVPDHPKFTRLKRRLKLGRFQALGLLESLWHFTAKFCPTGDVGRYSDTDIEDWIEWDGAPGEAVKALEESRWLDPDAGCRLYVHDWHEFSDDATDNALARHGKRYANGKAPRMRRLGKEERALRSLRYAELCDSVRTEKLLSAHNEALPVTSTSNQLPENKKPPRAKRDVDPRHVPFKDAFFESFEAHNGQEPSWGKREAGSLGDFLSATPKIDVEKWRTVLKNYFSSEGVNGAPLSTWVNKAQSYWKGPLDRFGKTIQEKPLERKIIYSEPEGAND